MNLEFSWHSRHAAQRTDSYVGRLGVQIDVLLLRSYDGRALVSYDPPPPLKQVVWQFKVGSLSPGAKELRCGCSRNRYITQAGLLRCAGETSLFSVTRTSGRRRTWDSEGRCRQHAHPS